MLPSRWPIGLAATAVAGALQVLRAGGLVVTDCQAVWKMWRRIRRNPQTMIRGVSHPCWLLLAETLSRHPSARCEWMRSHRTAAEAQLAGYPAAWHEGNARADTAAKDDKGSDKTAAKAEPAKAAEPRKEQTPVPEKVPPRYSFYNDLPKIEVTIPREYSKPAPANSSKPAPVPPAEVKKAIDAPGAYLIQVGAYKSREEADRRRASLALLGYESRIEQVTLDERDTRFRVRIGPQPTFEAAQAALAKLQQAVAMIARSRSSTGPLSVAIHRASCALYAAKTTSAPTTRSACASTPNR